MPIPTINSDTDIVAVGNRARNPGSFNINSFMSDISARGVLRTHSFMVNIVPPVPLRDRWTDARNILIRCEGASLPAANFQMAELFRHGYGAQESSPHNIQFEPVNLTFLLDGKSEIYSFWYEWLNAIMNFNRSSGLNTPDRYGKDPYEMSYKDDYATEIKILIYNENADAVIQSTLTEAFPLGMPEVPLNWNNTNEVMRINIPISYRDYFTQTTFSDTSRNVSNFLSSTIPSNQMNKNSIRDSFALLGFNALSSRTSKLDNILADILLN